MTFKDFENHCVNLKLLGFRVSRSVPPAPNNSWIIVQKQLVGRMFEKEDGALSLEFKKEEFYDRNMDSNIHSKSLKFWHERTFLNDTTTEENQIAAFIQNLDNNINEYARQVTKTVDFTQLDIQEQNAYILPFFLAEYDPEFCSAVLPYNVTAGNTLVTLLVEQKITPDDVDLFKDLSEETLNAFID